LPVIDPAEVLSVVRLISGSVDVIKVGKLNHDPARERTVDWPSFTRQAIALMHSVGQTYYIKRDLWRACAGKVEGLQSWPA
jgi:hypothetical protein